MANLNTMVNKARASSVSSVGFPWRLLLMSLIIFGLTILVWVGIQFGYIPFLNSEISKADANFTTLSGKIDANQQTLLTDYYSQMYNIQALSRSHLYPSRIFDFLEKNIYPLVRINSLQAGVTGGDVSFDGIASDFNTLTNQLAILKADPSVGVVSLSSAQQRDAKSGGGVSFSIRITFNRSFFGIQK
jgi:Tfp pilus assembly protein PilN